MAETGSDLEPRRSLLLRGVLDMCVLAMIQRQPDHVYGLAGRLAEHGLDRVSFGSLYPLVTRLRQQGLLRDTTAASPVGPPRTMLTVTATGQATLHRWSAQWRTVNDAVTQLLDHDDEPSPPEPTHAEDAR